MGKKNGFWSEFKTFIARGNVVDMAVGVVVGSAFTAIVNSLVKNIINPVIGLITGGVDFGQLKIVLRAATQDKPELVITYGVFINAIVNFLIISLVVFTVVRGMNKFKAKADEKKKAEEQALASKIEEEKKNVPPEKSADIILLEEIRDLLKNKA